MQSESNRLKKVSCDGHTAHSKESKEPNIWQRRRQKEREKFHGSNKKCGDNTVDGILIMRAKRHRQQSAAKLLSNERETREFNRNQFVRRERHACENKGIFGFGYLPRVIVKNEPQRISLLSTDGVLHFFVVRSFAHYVCVFFSLSCCMQTSWLALIRIATDFVQKDFNFSGDIWVFFFPFGCVASNTSRTKTDRHGHRGALYSAWNNAHHKFLSFRLCYLC